MILGFWSFNDRISHGLSKPQAQLRLQRDRLGFARLYINLYPAIPTTTVASDFSIVSAILIALHFPCCGFRPIIFWVSGLPKCAWSTASIRETLFVDSLQPWTREPRCKQISTHLTFTRGTEWICHVAYRDALILFRAY